MAGVSWVYGGSVMKMYMICKFFLREMIYKT